MRKEYYKKSIFKYGIIPVLIVLMEHEAYERYEECSCIMEAISEINSIFIEEKNKLPTKMDIDVIDEVKAQLGIASDFHFIFRMNGYASKILMETEYL